MNPFKPLASIILYSSLTLSASTGASQAPLLQHAQTRHPVSQALFDELEEHARLVDIAYCVGGTSLGIIKPFNCLSRCADFPEFELVSTWNTGPLASDSCGYIALDHGEQRVIVAFRGTYSIANTVVDLSTVPQEYVPYPGDGEDDVAEDEVEEITIGETIDWEALKGVGGYVKREQSVQTATVHMGFHTAWLHTRDQILNDLTEQLLLNPDYALHFVGHSLGGAVAALGALDLQARGWDPVVTTFGEPRIGNAGLVQFLDDRFNLSTSIETGDEDVQRKYRRVTHVNDPVPLLPLSEWNYNMHAGEIFISKSALSPELTDLQHCDGDVDQDCIAGQDSTTSSIVDSQSKRKRDLIESVKNEVHDVVHEPWGIPSRYKLWQLFFSHRDYFWRLGLCVPSSELGGEEFEAVSWNDEIR